MLSASAIHFSSARDGRARGMPAAAKRRKSCAALNP